jgi:hypothetical protein
VALVDQPVSGTGSIDEKFWLSRIQFVPFVLVQLQVHFQRESGAAGAYTAPLLIRRFSGAGRRFDHELRRLESAGMNADDTPNDINLRIGDEERKFYRLAAEDALRITWADPSAGVVAWGIIATLDVQEA